MLRWADVPVGGLLAEQRVLHPDDPFLRELHTLTARNQLDLAARAGCPFHPNPPPAGSLPGLAPGRIPLATLPTGDVLSIGVNALCRNLLIVGPTGGGKSNYLRVLIAAFLESLP